MHVNDRWAALGLQVLASLCGGGCSGSTPDAPASVEARPIAESVPATTEPDTTSSSSAPLYKEDPPASDEKRDFCDARLRASVRMIPDPAHPGAYRIYGVRRYELWGLLGVQNGDSLLRLCGRSLEEARALLGRPLRDFPAECSLELRRNGSPLTLEVGRACPASGR